MKLKKGLVYVFEGEGKGKTSAALGVALRMLLLKNKVVWIAWFKSLKWSISEARLSEVFKDNLEMYWTGEGFYIKEEKSKPLNGGAIARDLAEPDEHRLAALKARNLAMEILNSLEPPQLLVLDEMIKAVNDDLLSVEEVLEVVKIRRATHLVITGHDCPDRLRKIADLVTEMKKIKHPYDKGTLAVKGLDF